MVSGGQLWDVELSRRKNCTVVFGALMFGCSSFPSRTVALIQREIACVCVWRVRGCFGVVCGTVTITCWAAGGDRPHPLLPPCVSHRPSVCHRPCRHLKTICRSDPLCVVGWQIGCGTWYAKILFGHLPPRTSDGIPFLWWFCKTNLWNKKSHTWATTFLRLLAQTKASPRKAVEASLLSRWSAILAYAAQHAFAASLLALDCAGTSTTDKDAPSISQLLSEAPIAPPPTSRLPARPWGLDLAQPFVRIRSRRYRNAIAWRLPSKTVIHFRPSAEKKVREEKKKQRYGLKRRNFPQNRKASPPEGRPLARPKSKPHALKPQRNTKTPCYNAYRNPRLAGRMVFPFVMCPLSMQLSSSRPWVGVRVRLCVANAISPGLYHPYMRASNQMDVFCIR